MLHSQWKKVWCSWKILKYLIINRTQLNKTQRTRISCTTLLYFNNNETRQSNSRNDPLCIQSTFSRKLVPAHHIVPSSLRPQRSFWRALHYELVTLLTREFALHAVRRLPSPNLMKVGRRWAFQNAENKGGHRDSTSMVDSFCIQLVVQRPRRVRRFTSIVCSNNTDIAYNCLRFVRQVCPRGAA